MSSHEPKSMKTFYIIWIGQFISILGSGLTNFAFGFWIYEQTGKATPFALIALFYTIPNLLLAPIAGVVADRYNRRMIMIIADSGDAVVTLFAALMLFFGDLQIWHIYIIAFFSSVFAAFQRPANSASVTMLVPKGQLARAAGLSQMVYAVEGLLIPIAAGFLFPAIGMKGVILIDLISYAFAVGALLIVNIPQPKRKDIDENSKLDRQQFIKDAKFGFKYLKDRSGLLGLLFYFATVNFMLTFSGVLSTPLVLAFGTPEDSGIVSAAGGAAMLLGGITISIWGGAKRKIAGVIATIAFSSFGLMVMGYAPQTFTVAAGRFVLLFFIPMASAMSQTVWQTKVAPEVQGRVFAIRGMIASSITPIAQILAGPLADNVFEKMMAEGGAWADSWIASVIGVGQGRGIGLMFIMSGVLMWIISVAVYLTPRIRMVEDELPDAIIDAQEEDSTDLPVMEGDIVTSPTE